MANRSASAAATRNRILGATLQLATEKLSVEIVLAEVAERSGVTVQTVLRHFGTREGLFDAAVEYGNSEVQEEREAPIGDVSRAVHVIVDHYELRGDWVIALLGQETSDARIRSITTSGKQLHTEWVTRVFQPQLAARADRATTADLLAVATDVYTWKLLRRDRGLDRETTESRMEQLVRAIVAPEGS